MQHHRMVYRSSAVACAILLLYQPHASISLVFQHQRAILPSRRGAFIQQPLSLQRLPTSYFKAGQERNNIVPIRDVGSSSSLKGVSTGSVDSDLNDDEPSTQKSAIEGQKKGSNPGWLRRTFPGLPWFRLPNVLTYIRCIAIPVLAWVFYLPNRHVETSVIFAVASFTDWIDGYLARRWDITSDFGAFLDPVADKLMVSTALILLSGRYGAIVALPTALILAREIAVSALREWMAQRGQRDTVKVGMQGKIKTALTMVSLTLLLLVPLATPPAPTLASGAILDDAIYKASLVLLYASSGITVTSGIDYFRAAGPILFPSAETEASE